MSNLPFSPLELGALVPVGGLVVALVATATRHPAAPDGHTSTEHRRAAGLVAAHARDSLDPFALREDKRFHFAAGGVLAYRIVRENRRRLRRPDRAAGARSRRRGQLSRP